MHEAELWKLSGGWWWLGWLVFWVVLMTYHGFREKPEASALWFFLVAFVMVTVQFAWCLLCSWDMYL